jgi:hypothetical protein
MPREKQVLKYGDPDYVKHDPYGNYRSGVITGAGPTDEIRTHDGQLHIHAQGQWHNVHPPGGGSLPHGAYGIRWTLRPDEIERAGLDKIAMREPSAEERSTINNPDYKFYVLIGNQIESGWEYREDAKDEIKELPDPSAGKVYTKAFLKQRGIDPNNDDVWMKGPIGHMRTTRRMMSRRQPSLPGFPDVPDQIEIRIPTMPWMQIGGDMDPGAHGGLIATADGDHIELLQIQPVREYVGDKEAADVGFPFWTKEAYFNLDDLDPKNDDVKSALQSSGFDSGEQRIWFEEEATPEERALAIAEALISYGRGDDGPSGWSEDLPDHEVKWWGDKVATLPDYVADEDESFRDDVLGYDDLRRKLEEMVQEMADQSSATAWSTPGDQLVDDLADEGYDPESVVVVAEFGDAVAVNGDIETEKTYVGVMQSLEAEGYEEAPGGGDIPATEGYAYAEHVIEAVSRATGFSADELEAAAKGLDWWREGVRGGRGPGGEIPWSTSGDSTVFAKKKEGAGTEEARRRPRSSSARRRR